MPTTLLRALFVLLCVGALASLCACAAPRNDAATRASSPSPSGGGSPQRGGERGTSPRLAPAPPDPISQPFLARLAIKGMSNDDRTLATRILIRPALWDDTPYVLFDENGFTDFPDSPLDADAGALRKESRDDAATARLFWGPRPVRVMVNVEGWPLQADLALEKVRRGAGAKKYNAAALAALNAIIDGVESGWPEARGQVGFWAKIVTSENLERRDAPLAPSKYNEQAIDLWRRVGYLAAQVYPMTRLADSAAQARTKGYAAPDEWTRHVFESVAEMRTLRDRVAALDPDRRADPPDILPCIFGTRLGWRGAFKNQLMTPAEIRTLVRACHDAGADGVLVWQPIRSEQERREFQSAVEQIETELAAIRGLTLQDAERLAGRVTIGRWWGLEVDWPGRPMGWMRRKAQSSK